jgi:hypothetical protein
MEFSTFGSIGPFNGKLNSGILPMSEKAEEKSVFNIGH